MPKQIYNIIFLAIIGAGLVACGGSAPTPEKVPATPQDSVAIQSFYDKVERMLHTAITDTSAPTENCSFELVNGNGPTMIKMDELATLFLPDTFMGQNYAALSNIDMAGILPDMNARYFNHEFAEKLIQVEQSKYFMIVESVTSKGAQTAEDGFKTGFLNGTIHVFDYESEKILCQKLFSAENSEYVNSTTETLSMMLILDLREQVLATVSDSLNSMFGTNFNFDQNSYGVSENDSIGA